MLSSPSIELSAKLEARTTCGRRVRRNPAKLDIPSFWLVRGWAEPPESTALEKHDHGPWRGWKEPL